MVSCYLKTNEEFPLNSKYKLYKNKKIGKGAFGEVYLCEEIGKKNYYAVKLEKIKNNSLNNSQLKNEYNILKYLQGCIGIPQVYLYKNISNLNFLIIDLLGLNLESLLIKCNKHFSINTILNLSIQMIEIIEQIHIRHIIHRDIKPENFVMGLNNNTKKLYLIDFGLSKRFRNPKTGEHIKYKDGKNLIGTAKFSSIYTHLGIEQSRRDDLEGIFYTLICLFKGNLPWENLKAKNKEEKYQKILFLKMNYKIEKLCQDLPNCFSVLLSYVRSLQFEEKPNYDFIKRNLNQEFNFFILKNKFDWIVDDNLSISNNDNENLSTASNNKKSEDEKISNLKKIMN